MSDLEIREERVKKELAAERGRMRQSLQTIQSGSKEMRNMAGMMRLMNLARSIDENPK